MQTNRVLPEEAINEFKRLYKAKFNKELTDEEAIKRANNLFSLYEAVYGSSINKTKHG